MLSAEAALPAERSPGASQQVPAVAAEWRRSVVQGLFGGELSSTVVCGGCGYVSAAVESFMCAFACLHLLAPCLSEACKDATSYATRAELTILALKQYFADVGSMTLCFPRLAVACWHSLTIVMNVLYLRAWTCSPVGDVAVPSLIGRCCTQGLVIANAEVG